MWEDNTVLNNIGEFSIALSGSVTVVRYGTDKLGNLGGLPTFSKIIGVSSNKLKKQGRG